jgi:hypothetical protein
MLKISNKKNLFIPHRDEKVINHAFRGSTRIPHPSAQSEAQDAMALTMLLKDALVLDL